LDRYSATGYILCTDFPHQIPSQKGVPKGEKIRKQTIRKREAKLERYNRPKEGDKSQRQRKEKRSWKGSADQRDKS